MGQDFLGIKYNLSIYRQMIVWGGDDLDLQENTYLALIIYIYSYEY